MQEYTDDEFVELSKAVWDKLIEIHRARTVRRQRVMTPPAFHSPAGPPQPVYNPGAYAIPLQPTPSQSTPSRDHQLLDFSLGSAMAAAIGSPRRLDYPHQLAPATPHTRTTAPQYRPL